METQKSNVKQASFVIYNIEGTLYRGMIQVCKNSEIRVSGLGWVSKNSIVHNFEAVERMSYAIFVCPRDKQGYVTPEYNAILSKLPRYNFNPPW